MTLVFDHLAVAAQSLEAGTARIRDRLGVLPDPGGSHPMMGTHNRLLSLGPQDYLEIIAIDPDGAAPARPRWFGLDGFSGEPRLVGWVARGQDITAPPGATLSAASRGDLNWQIAIPDDGRPMGGGALPSLIDWQGGPHPCERLPDRGLRLVRLELSLGGTWPEWAAIDDPRIVRGTFPVPLRAVISTARGEVTL